MKSVWKICYSIHKNSENLPVFHVAAQVVLSVRLPVVSKLCSKRLRFSRNFTGAPWRFRQDQVLRIAIYAVQISCSRTLGVNEYTLSIPARPSLRIDGADYRLFS